MQQSYLNNYYQDTNTITPIVANQIYVPMSPQAMPLYEVSELQQFNHNGNKNNVNQNRWNIRQQNGQTNLNNFPFGKDNVKISNYVADQMKSSIDQQNKRIIDKFRIQAIKQRNQRVMRHLGKIPYVSQSMMPGSSVDVSRLVQRERVIPRHNITYTQPRHQRYTSVSTSNPPEIVPVLQISQKFPNVKKPRKLTNKSSVGVEVNFEQEFPLLNKKKNNRRYYTIEEQQEIVAIDRIQQMIHEINTKLKKNTQMLSRCRTINESQIFGKSRFNNSKIPNEQQVPENKSFIYQRKQYFNEPQSPRNNIKYPTVEYTNTSSVKSQVFKNPRERYSESLKKHLKQIKKKRKRLEDLDEYIYR